MSRTPDNREGSRPPQNIMMGRYTIHELIGVGGMAEVYRASMAGPGGFRKPVVIKRVRQKHAQEDLFIKMFVDEAKLSASLDHPNIVALFEFGESEGHYYIVMEWVDGLNLHVAHIRHEQKAGKPLPWQATTLIVRDMLRALDFAHNKADQDGKPLGLIHRDINLTNVMIRRDGTVKVLDFGIAKAREGIRSAETVEGVLKGKFSYMSPEQVMGKNVDARSDVFTSAIVYHELLTGHRLFGGGDGMAILTAVKEGPIPDPRQIVSGIPEQVVNVVMKGLIREPEGRYSSAGLMADALDEIVFEHRIRPTLLKELMQQIMEDERVVIPSQERARRYRLTLASWEGEVTESEFVSQVKEESPRPRMTSGAVDSVTGTGSGRESLISSMPLITTAPRWQTPMPVDGEGESEALQPPGDTIVERAASDADPASMATTISSPPVPIDAQKTMILDDLNQQKTIILESDSPDIVGSQRPVGTSSQTGSATAYQGASEEMKRVGGSPTLGFKILVVVTVILALAAVTALIFKIA